MSTQNPATLSAETVLEARAVYKIFVTRNRVMAALRDVNLAVQRGEFLCLLGPSGCGKSTLLNMFGGLVAPVQGEILFHGKPVNGVNTRVGYITQDDNLLPWRTTLRNVEIALELKGVSRNERREKGLAFLERVGLADFEDHYPAELSGGMRKRVSIARTLIDDSVNVVLMDEPFGPLDAQTRLVLQDELMQLWHETGHTIVFVTHDIVEAITLSDRIAIFTSGPGAIKNVREIDLPRPRDVFHIHDAPGFRQLYDSIWTELRDEILKSRAKK